MITRTSSSMRASSVRCLFLLWAALALGGCREPLAPTITMQVRGTVRLDGTPMANARVILRDQRTESEQGYILGLATADASGRYDLTALAERPGYGLSCDNMFLYVEGHRFGTELSVALRCTNEAQNIDLNITDSSFQSGRR